MQHPKVPGRWYILRYDKHDIDFGHKAFLRAGAHLSSAQHGRLSRDSEVVIEHFGTEVLNCDEDLAAMNNASGHTVLRKKRKHKRLSARMTQKRRKRAEYAPLADPSAGQLYRGLWGKAKKSWAVLVLPTEDLGEVGLSGSMESLGLTKAIPPCYIYDERTRAFSWAEGYEDGGPKTAERKFPVAYFNASGFPEKSTVGWLGAKDLATLDVGNLDSAGIPHAEMVREYLRQRNAAPAAVTDLEACTAFISKFQISSSCSLLMPPLRRTLGKLQTAPHPLSSQRRDSRRPHPRLRMHLHQPSLNRPMMPTIKPLHHRAMIFTACTSPRANLCWVLEGGKLRSLT